jgi:hypothetical protein
VELKSVNKYIGLIPIVGVALALVIELTLGLRGQYVFNPPYLLLGLGLVIGGGVSFIVAYLSARGYLLTGSLTLLFITISFILSGGMVTLSGWVANYSPNWGVTTAAIGLLLFSVFQLLSSIQASFRSVPIGSEHRKTRLTLACSGVILLSGLLTLMIGLTVFPLFFINGIGVTLTDKVVYAIIISLLLLSSVFFSRLYLKSKSVVLYWYSLALVLDAIGLYGLTLQVRFSDIVVWTGRLGAYIATIYFLIALLSSRKSSNEAENLPEI